MIVDLDGVLLYGRYFSDRLGEKYGIPRTEIVEVLKTSINNAKKTNEPTFRMWEPYLKKWHVPLSENDFFSLWFEGDLEIPENIAFFSNFVLSIENVVVLANNFRERSEYIKQRVTSLQTFDAVYFSNEIGFTKDEPQCFTYVMDHYGVSVDETVVIDSSELVIKTAQQLGIHTIQYENLNKVSVQLREFGLYTELNTTHL